MSLCEFFGCCGFGSSSQHSLEIKTKPEGKTLETKNSKNLSGNVIKFYIPEIPDISVLEKQRNKRHNITVLKSPKGFPTPTTLTTIEE